MRTRTFGTLLILCTVVILFSAVPCAHASGKSIVLCRIGESASQAWSLLRQYFEGKGYQVIFYQGETTIEGHVEKVNGLNRGPARAFVAIELIPAARTRILVAMTDAKKGEGRFLTIDQIPDRFAGESEKLAAAVAAPFKVKVKRLPLFPLLGVNMPGVFVQMQFKEDEFEDRVKQLYSGIERYFTERATK
jgi:hypothetical protein